MSFGFGKISAVLRLCSMCSANVFNLFGKHSSPRASIYIFTSPGANPDLIQAFKRSDQLQDVELLLAFPLFYVCLRHKCLIGVRQIKAAMAALNALEFFHLSFNQQSVFYLFHGVRNRIEFWMICFHSLASERK